MFAVPERLKAKCDTISIPITIADPDAIDCPLVYCNQCFSDLTGFQAEDIIGQNCRFLQRGELDPDIRKRMKASIEKQESISTCILNYRKDGTPFKNLLFMETLNLPQHKKTMVVGYQYEFNYTTTDQDISSYTNFRFEEMAFLYKLSLKGYHQRKDALQMQSQSAIQLIKAHMGSI